MVLRCQLLSQTLVTEWRLRRIKRPCSGLQAAQVKRCQDLPVKVTELPDSLSLLHHLSFQEWGLMSMIDRQIHTTRNTRLLVSTYRSATHLFAAPGLDSDSTEWIKMNQDLAYNCWNKGCRYVLLNHLLDHLQSMTRHCVTVCHCPTALIRMFGIVTA